MGRRRILRSIILFFFLLAYFSFFRPVAYAASNINNTKHNLSVSGPGTYKALTETRICIFCHTPHNATPDTPLWNKELQSQTYNIYTSDSALPVVPSQPTGPTKLCLSCHDGTVALGATVNPSGGISMGGGTTLPPVSLSYFGTNLSNHHPVVFSYVGAQQADTTGQLVESALLPPTLALTGQGIVHCITCHDPHDDTYGKFLVMDNRDSTLCTTCHQMSGWTTSGHATNVTFDLTGILPRPPKNWPAWTQMKEWGCEVCHTPHLAATPPKLLNFCSDPCPPPYTSSFTCTTASCHSSTPSPIHTTSALLSTAGRRTASSPILVGKADIGGQVKKRSGHHEQPGSMMAAQSRKNSSYASVSGASCVDCHNSHAANNQKAIAPDVSGMLKGVTGVDMNGTEVHPARYEYEICFKCHGDFNPVYPYVPRVVNTVNKRTAFAEINPSYHPVIGRGKNISVPSIPTQYEPSMTPSSIIYCSDCHSDDSSNSRGPHGSDFVPILRLPYETADNTIENIESYALCYQCHDRSSILSDASFEKKISRATPTGGGHSGHLAAGAPCSACHDSHGVNDDNGMTGSHTHLINFDTRLVGPAPGNTYPFFTDLGTFSGSCTLVCHGKTHINETYPQGGISSQGFSPSPSGLRGIRRR